MMRGLIAIMTSLAAWLVFTTLAHAQVELKNDGFQSGQMGAFQGGFAIGEIGASRFVAPEAGRHLQRIVFLFGGASTTQNVTIKVWDDTAGTDTPGTELYMGDFGVTGSDTAFHLSDVASDNIILPVQFRVGVKVQHAGYPALARDGDGNIAADRNFIYAEVSPGTFVWIRSTTAGLTGDWVIRAEISASGGGSLSDAGVTIDAPPGSGGPCAGNAQCPIGQYCNLTEMTCTFDCRTNDDCGGNTCNSLGQCVGLDGDGAGCGCQSGDGGALGLVLGLGLFLAARRR